MLRWPVAGEGATQRLEEFVLRQSYTVAKLERDGAGADEIRLARKHLKSFEGRLEAARRRNQPGE